MSKMTSAFRSMERVQEIGLEIVNTDDRDAWALVRCARKTKELFLRWLWMSMQVRTCRWCQQQQPVDNYWGVNYSRVAVHKPLITKMNAHLRVQWGLSHWSTEMWGKKVTWLDGSYSRQVGECTKRTVQAWVLDPYSKGTPVALLCGAFCWHDMCSLICLWGGGKVVLSDHLYSMMKHFYSNGSASRMTMPPSIEHVGLLIVLMSMKIMWITCYGLRSHQISTQLNTYRRFWINVLHSALQHHHQNTKQGISLRRMVLLY